MPRQRRRRSAPREGGRRSEIYEMLRMLYMLEYSQSARRIKRRSISIWAVTLIISLSGLLLFVTVDAYGYDRTTLKIRNGFRWVGELIGLVEPGGGDTVSDGLLRDIPLESEPTMSATRIDEVLAASGSPAVGTGSIFYREGVATGINPAIPLGFFRNENGYMTNPGAADKGNGETTKNLGNIICAGYPTCFNGFRDYASWEDAIKDWFRLIDKEYIEGRGHRTIHDVTAVYVPFGHGNNNPDSYADNVGALVVCWAEEDIPVRDCEAKASFNGSGAPPTVRDIRGDRPSDDDNTGTGDVKNVRPQGNPLNDARTVMTQGYGVGSHAPAEVWGGIDLAIDGDGDGYAEEGPTWDAPIYATHDGTVELTHNNPTAGNFLKLRNGSFRTSYGHQSKFAVTHGQFIRKGDLLGYVGSTGQSSGPHLHYEVWEIVEGAEVNRNPLDYDALTNQQRIASKPEDGQSGLDIEKYKEKFTDLRETFVAWVRTQRERVVSSGGTDSGSGTTQAGADNNFDLHVTDGLYPTSDERAALQSQTADALGYVQARVGTKLKSKAAAAYVTSSDCSLHGLAMVGERILQTYTCNSIPMEAAVSIQAHEFVHQLAYDRYGTTGGDNALQEGFATWGAGKYWMGGTEDAKGNGRSWRDKYYSATGSYLPLDQIVYGQSAFVMNTGYYQWASFVDFLISTYGRDKFDAVFVTGTGAAGSADYQTVYGKSFAELEAEWQIWLYQ